MKLYDGFIVFFGLLLLALWMMVVYAGLKNEKHNREKCDAVNGKLISTGKGFYLCVDKEGRIIMDNY